MNIKPFRRTVTLAALGALAVGLAACGDDEDTSSKAVVVSDAWARTSPMSATNGAAYMTIVSPVDDALLSAAVDATVAAKVELHETVAAETSMPADTSMGGATTMPGSGMMEMRPVERIALPAGTPVLLVPGGYHVMLLDLAAPLLVGSTISLTLTFETAGTTTVSVPVRDSAP